MRIVRFDESVGRAIQAFGSNQFIISKVVRAEPKFVQIGYAHLGTNGLIGYHQAACPQLLVVVQGEGWVRSGEGERLPVKAGQGVYWEQGEWHETGTAGGLTAMLIEADALDVSGLPEVE
ncbi:cupin domain-containing protein [Paenibacillus turpanensis]|uniref:cupin domain-containing protein n=1 Tax=Paenibacillus turpanensis TaxID=2689078 RepID=UPI0014085E15|nr:cupin domain-containing protein [Paenibacillus turpanensis]